MVSLTTVVIARPDIGLQLRDKSFASSYGVPSASITNLNQHSFLPPSASFQTPFLSTSVPFNSGFVSTEAPVSSTPAPFYDDSSVSSTPAPFYGAPSVSTTPAPFYGAPSTTPSPFYGAPSFSTTLSPFISTTPSPFGDSSAFSGGGLPYNQDPSLFGGSQFSSLQSSQFINTPQVIEQKHVYFYEAPEEPEIVTPSPIPAEAPKKNVKIIFIKAPQFAQPIVPKIPAPPENHEKTIVYVLVKKPEEQPPIVIPTLAPTVPAKPEVFFIKYKNQAEAELKVSETLNEHSNSGANIITSGVDTNGLASGGLLGNPYLDNQIISSTESPLGLGGSFLSTSTLNPFSGGNSYSGLGSDLSNFQFQNQGLGLGGQFVASTEPSLINSTPYNFAPIHPTYGPPNKK